MKNAFVAAALAALILSASAASAAPLVVGKVEEVQGVVKLLHTGDKGAHAAKPGEAVSQGDTFNTDENSRVRMTFADNTQITLANHGRLVINDYVYDPKKPEGNKAQFSVVGAAFSYAGGLLDKVANPDVKVNLDFGSIGIRGTKIYRTMKHKECWIFVEQGNIVVSNKAGTVSLAQGQGTTMTAKSVAPTPAHIWTPKEIAWIKGTLDSPWNRDAQ